MIFLVVAMLVQAQTSRYACVRFLLISLAYVQPVKEVAVKLLWKPGAKQTPIALVPHDQVIKDKDSLPLPLLTPHTKDKKSTPAFVLNLRRSKNQHPCSHCVVQDKISSRPHQSQIKTPPANAHAQNFSAADKSVSQAE
jgi:hypothetical protein